MSALLTSALQRAWKSRGPLACALWPIAQFYGALISLRAWLYARGICSVKQAGVPTIVVGNVVAGGGGKTPLVMALVAYFSNQGIKVGVVSRGYGRNRSDCQEVLENTPIDESGDEPALIKRARAAPVFVATDRLTAAKALLAVYPQTRLLICDDGLQHLRLSRTLNVVVFDDGGLGNGWLLPAGPLRQPWPLHGQSAAPLVLHTGVKPAFSGFVSRRELAGHAVAANGTRVPLASLQTSQANQAVLIALAGIAHPEAFFDMLRAKGLSLSRTVAMPDHADFSRFDLASLKRLGEAQLTVLCTEKDAVKIFQLAQRPDVRVLAVPLLFTPEPAFFTALEKALRLPTE